MLKIVKKPQPLAVCLLFLYDYKMAGKKKVLPPTPFGDVIIHETGTRLTKEGDVRDGNHSQDQTMFHRQGVCKQGGVIEADRKQGRKHNEVDQ